MANIFINIPILLKNRSQVVKDVFLRYHLTIESNIPLLLCASTEITRPTKPKRLKHFVSKVRLHSSD
jgi:hypothetical protein